MGKLPFKGMSLFIYSPKTGLGSRFGSQLLERGYKPNYNHLSTHIEGCGGLWEQFPHQGIDPAGIIAAVKKLIKD
jgi:hypothetical protein